MAASDKVLGELHRQVAEALSEQVVGYTEEGEDGVAHTVRPSPALLGAAISFLKNNNITADVEQNDALRQLKETLAERKSRKTPQAMLDAVAEQYSDSMGGLMQ